MNWSRREWNSGDCEWVFQRFVIKLVVCQIEIFEWRWILMMFQNQSAKIKIIWVKLKTTHYLNMWCYNSWRFPDVYKKPNGAGWLWFAYVHIFHSHQI